jgi:hypothetical protein
MYCSAHSLTSVLDGGEWSASRPGRFTSRERAPGTHWIGGCVGPRAVLDAVVKRKFPSPRRESNPRTPIDFPGTHFNIILSPMPKSSKRCLRFRFSIPNTWFILVTFVVCNSLNVTVGLYLFLIFLSLTLLLNHIPVPSYTFILLPENPDSPTFLCTPSEVTRRS